MSLHTFINLINALQIGKLCMKTHDYINVKSKQQNIWKVSTRETPTNIFNKPASAPAL